MRKIMLIGSQGSGKTTLIQSLKNEELKYKKTQALIFDKYFLDTPGEYLEHKNYLNSLLVSSYDYDIVGFLQAANNPYTMFSPKLNTFFNMDCIGIITKIDINENKNTELAEKILLDAGANKIFTCSGVTNVGINELRDYLENKI